MGTGKRCGLMAIDPGLNSMGWAYWAVSPTDRPPTRVGLIKAPRKLDLAPRSLWVARQLELELHELDKPGGSTHHEVDFVSEFPAWHGIQLGWAAGDLQRLVFLVGVLAGYFRHAHSFTPVTPGDWKGQLPKDVVTRRLIKRFGKGATLDWEKDVWDAVGIGLWKMGRF
jgi:hypothetical protein